MTPRSHDQLLFSVSGRAGLRLQPHKVVDVSLAENVVPTTVVVNGDVNLLPVFRHVGAVVEVTSYAVFENVLQHRFGFLSFEPVLVQLFAEDSTDEARL